MEQQQVDENLLKEFLEFGFEEKHIKMALQLTQDKEQATELIFQFQQDDIQDSQNQSQNNQQQPQQFQPQGIDIANANLFGNLSPEQLMNMANQGLQFKQQAPDKNYKMIFLVRMDLKMGVGKIAAQVGHATLGAYQRIEELAQKEEKYNEALEIWQMYGQPKIVVKVETEKEFLEIEEKARNKGINTYIVEDAGRTQVEPGSKTVCAIGPGVVEEIDEIAKHLKLL